MDVLKATKVKYLVADGYFMKHDFIDPLTKEALFPCAISSCCFIIR